MNTLRQPTLSPYRTATNPRLLTAPVFSPITRQDIPLLAAWTQNQPTRSCDYTLGGIILWADFFDYRIAFASSGEIIIDGLHPNDPTRRVIGLPVPDDNIDPNRALKPLGEKWSDYLYDIYSFSSLAGNAMKKKRNHVNRFRVDNPSAILSPLTPANARFCLRILARLGNDGSQTGRAEQIAVARMLLHWNDFAPFMTGAVLKLNPDDDNSIVAFTIGETKGDTLHVHIEKADHTVPGAGETIAHLFAARALTLNPSLQIINRQDDAGSPAIRNAKLSWRPLSLLQKYI